MPGDVARLLTARDRRRRGSVDRATSTTELGVDVLTLWQTGDPAAVQACGCADEINEALRYYELSPVRGGRRAAARRSSTSSTGLAGIAVDACRRRADGVVDRRRPRRQPVRDRRRAALAVEPPGRDGARRTTSTGSRRLGRRAVDVVAARHADAGAAALAEASRRRLAVPRRRALPAGAAGHVRPAGARPRRARLGPVP